MPSNKKKFVILGAGPCGLGAAWRLQELGINDYEVFEKNDYVGGLAASFEDDKGFTWDIGGHVLFSHFDYFDTVMKTVLPKEQWLQHERESWVWMRDRFIPYPLQYNIGRLPQVEMMECLEGLVKSENGDIDMREDSFLDWIMHSFGKGLARHFMIPYNKKVWAYPPEDLSAHWIGERVAVPDVQRIMENIILGRDDCSWGPNNTFSFPLVGGTGAIWRAVAGHLPQEKIHFNSELEFLDCEKKVLRFANGQEQNYDYLISTIPIDLLLKAQSAVKTDSDDTFVYSSSNIIGIGLKGDPPENLRTKCWMYFPEEDNPFYRVTVFSNYSPQNVPGPGYWSLMGEVAESPSKLVDQQRLLELSLQGFNNTKLIENNSDVVSTWTFRAEYGYPTPFRGRDKLVNKYLDELQGQDIYSRGRFGAWKYESSNMDHVFMQGVEAVEHVLFDTPELAVSHPAFVNSNRVR